MYAIWSKDGNQFIAYSSDGGTSWSRPARLANFDLNARLAPSRPALTRKYRLMFDRVLVWDAADTA